MAHAAIPERRFAAAAGFDWRAFAKRQRLQWLDVVVTHDRRMAVLIIVPTVGCLALDRKDLKLLSNYLNVLSLERSVVPPGAAAKILLDVTVLVWVRCQGAVLVNVHVLGGHRLVYGRWPLR